MPLKCPACGVDVFGRSRPSAAIERERRCPSCGRLIAARPGAVLRIVQAVLENVLFFGSAVISLFTGSWIPVILGAILSIGLLPVVISALSPWIISTEAAERRRYRRRFYVAAVILAAAIIVGILSP